MRLDEADLAELRSRSVSTDLDPSHFFRNELAQAIQEIRRDYESRVESQRNDLQNRYSLYANELIMQQQRPDGGALQNETQRRHEERLRSEVSQAKNQTNYLRAQNEGVRNQIEDLKRRLASMRDEGGAAQAKMARDIQEAKDRLGHANQVFDDVSNMKTSLEKEISTYRDLLESKV